MITETLWLKILTSSRLFQTQLLKLYFLTTLYVDVKEPAPNFFGVMFSAHFRRQKNSILTPTSITFPLSLPGQN